MQTTNTYQKWADVAKGLGIIFVVLGHSGNIYLNHYLYWFHMPLFFIISGYFFKPIENSKDLLAILKKYTCRLLMPYFTYLIILTLLRYANIFLYDRANLNWLIQDICKLILGGRLIGGLYGPFWFITTLYFTYIIFTIILIYIKKDSIVLTLVGILYLIAHFESWLNITYNFIVPFNFDVSLIAISYFAFGYYAKYILTNLTKTLFYASSLTTVVFYISSFLGLFSFSFNMKILQYHNIILDFIIPIVITVTIIGLSQIIVNYKISDSFAYLGKQSLSIMYLHILPNMTLQSIFGYGTLTYTIIGIVFPLLVTRFILSRYNLTKTLFLGKENMVILVKN